MAVDLRKHHEGINGAVAAELRAEKAAQSLTNQDLADRTGIPVVSVQRYLAPSRAVDVDVLRRLAAALGKTAGEVMAAAEERLARQNAGPGAGSGAGPDPRADMAWHEPRIHAQIETVGPDGSVTLTERLAGKPPRPEPAERESDPRR